MSIQLNDQLKKEYQVLYNTCVVTDSKSDLVKDITNKIFTNKNRYDAVAALLNIPWHFIAVIHNMEASLNFTRHLHNGDSLAARTIHVPAGRPVKGSPPFP